ncbi:hypothetical protein [Marinitoga sp. 1155]|uniref:hypothetical protein n=1 Tax=Marinitoga sp. 1155 TaxID=1428448 RepID=UPI000640E8BF|nr:hypothetical protein [Marinitoga sp. 1155]AMS33979.1 hypothetical protein UF09_63 [Marinitoga camini virus 2]KLO24789.1 hypothetical protein X274_02210 [Marinitoga sp. 1155]
MKTQKWTISIKKLPIFAELLKSYMEFKDIEELEIKIELENEKDEIKSIEDMLSAITTKELKLSSKFKVSMPESPDAFTLDCGKIIR